MNYQCAINFILSFFLLLTFSCNSENEYFPYEEEKKVFYNVSFQDKESRKKIFRQSYYFLPKIKNNFPVLKNDGEIIFYEKSEKGIEKKKTNDFFSSEYKSTQSSSFLDKDLIIAFPISKETKWETNDKTTLQMKVGYDRLFDTNLPFKLKNKIVNINDTINLNGRKIKNCIKIVGYGKTSYDPGPPLGNINIEISSSAWFAKNVGLVKYKREEKSDSETMGKIIYEKTMLIND
jgi:hypothetical protein